MEKEDWTSTNPARPVDRFKETVIFLIKTPRGALRHGLLVRQESGFGGPVPSKKAQFCRVMGPYFENLAAEGLYWNFLKYRTIIDDR